MHNCERFRQLQGVRAAETFESSHRPDGKMADVLAIDSRLHNYERFGQLQSVRAEETFKSSHRPDGKIADVVASTHDCTTAADAPVNYRMYVQQRTLKSSHRPDGKMPCPRWEDG